MPSATTKGLWSLHCVVSRKPWWYKSPKFTSADTVQWKLAIILSFNQLIDAKIFLQVFFNKLNIMTAKTSYLQNPQTHVSKTFRPNMFLWNKFLINPSNCFFFGLLIQNRSSKKPRFIRHFWKPKNCYIVFTNKSHCDNWYINVEFKHHSLGKINPFITIVYTTK